MTRRPKILLLLPCRLIAMLVTILLFVPRKVPISRVVSMGRRNTFLKLTRRRLKTQSLSWALI